MMAKSTKSDGMVPKPNKSAGMPQGERVEEKGRKGGQASGSGSRESSGKEAGGRQPNGSSERKGARETPKSGKR
jgi:hypothetical protein